MGSGPEFKENLVGRLGNFPLSVQKPLMAVFEAVSNSIHAIEDSKQKGGCITVHIHRSKPTSPPLMPEAKAAEPVSGFTIEDNGVGFTDINFASFCEADSTFKKARGGKGVGRLSWLKVFQKAEIESVYLDSSGTKKKRTFSFTAQRPIEDYTLVDAPDADIQTIIRLVDFWPEFQKHCPKNYDTIARKLIEHFLTLFVLSSCPTIFLIDKDEGTEQSLNRIFKQEISQHSKVDILKLNGYKFRLQHFRMATRSQQPEHEIHFCARSRSVESRDLTKMLSNLRGALFDDNTGQFAYAGYVSGELLDECVNQERTRLDLLHDNTLVEDQDEPTRERLLREIASKSEAFLEPYLGPIKVSKLSRIKDYIQKRPKFRPLFKLRPEWLDQIRADVSDDELDIELYRLMHHLEIEVRTEGIQLRSEQAEKTAKSVDDHKKKFEKFLDEANQVGFSKLAEYVIHRRAVIDFLSECMKYDDDGRYRLEEVVHDVIFPMRSTSSDIPDPDQSNLWMIDERLSYHYYLSSDLMFRKTGEIEVAKNHDGERVDLLILQPYDRPHAFVGTNQKPFDSITIIEFKRPNRDDHSEDDDDRDPIAQVWRYAEKIQKGNVKDKNGQFVKTGDGTQFYAYVVCNLTPKMDDLANFHSFTRMPDNLGYFRWQPNYRVYTEILDYQKLIQDAKKRNEVFFDKFNLPPLT